MLADLIEAVAENLRQSKLANVEIRQTNVPRDGVTPSDNRFQHSYAIWEPFQLDEPESHKGKKVWRVQEFLGLHRANTDTASSDDWNKVVDDPIDPDLIILDDAHLGFRDHPEYWPQVLSSNISKPWILLKMARPVAEGKLWSRLLDNHADRLVVVMTLDDLRRSEVQISRQVSWERTAQDLVWELLCNNRVKSLARCKHIVVSCYGAGAVLLTKERNSGTAATLLFDQDVMEGEWERAHEGYMIGYTSCLAAGIARELILNPAKPKLNRGIQSGIHAMRSLHWEGYGNADSAPEKISLAFPASNIAAKLAEDGSCLAVAPIKHPVPERSASATTPLAGEAPVFWTILGDQNPDSLESIAQEVVRQGLEHALSGVPVGRFGHLLAVDRREIEALRSISSLIHEYCLSSQNKPLSIAVFGPPGSGKSFAVEQVAGSVGPGKIEKLTFNLSQFSGPGDLLDAFHQVRDKALSGKIPLVFWDEFDTSLGPQTLGWLRLFLAPMQDGEFREGQITHPIGQSIFVFVGGTSPSVEAFGADLDEQAYRAVKLPDFISRLKGFLNIVGPNRQRGQGPRGAVEDPYYVIRRAILLRSRLERDAPQVLRSDGGRKIAKIDEGVLRAFLLTKEYKHGARSLAAIVGMSQLAGKTAFERSSLPTEAQLDLHVDGREFFALMQRMELDEELLEKLAEAAHEVFCDSLRAKGYVYGPETREEERIHSSLRPYAELPEEEKEQNRNNVRDIRNKLESVGYDMLPAPTNEAPSAFKKDEVEKLAKMEHERWMQEKLDAGWKHAKTTAKAKKLHQSLVPWDELPPDEQDKDRAFVTGIPNILAEAGYTMVKLS